MQPENPWMVQAQAASQTQALAQNRVLRNTYLLLARWGALTFRLRAHQNRQQRESQQRSVAFFQRKVGRVV